METRAWQQGRQDREWDEDARRRRDRNKMAMVETRAAPLSISSD